MKTDFHELKKEFVRKKVADANQFIDNIEDCYLGYAEAIEPVDKDFLSYRKYQVHLGNQRTFHDMIIKKTKMKLYPFASNRQFVIYEKDELSEANEKPLADEKNE